MLLLQAHRVNAETFVGIERAENNFLCKKDEVFNLRSILQKIGALTLIRYICMGGRVPDKLDRVPHVH